MDGYINVLNMMRGAMPDVAWHVEETISEQNKIVVRFTMTGTNTGEFMDKPATHKAIRVTAINIYQIANGKIVHEHGLPDLFSILLQLGVQP